MNNKQTAGLADSILQSRHVTPECLVQLARKLNYSVKSGGFKYTEENLPALREEISEKLSRIEEISDEIPVKAAASNLIHKIAVISPDDFYHVASEVCGLFDKFFKRHGVNPANLEKKLFGTVNGAYTPEQNYTNPVVEEASAEEEEKKEEEEEVKPLESDEIKKTESDEVKPPESGERTNFSVDKIRFELEKFLGGDDIAHILNCIRKGQPKMLTSFGNTLPEHLRQNFFTVMSDFFPNDGFFALMAGKCADEGESEKLTVSVQRLLNAENSIRFLPSASALARRSKDKGVMMEVMDELEKHILRDVMFLNEYALLACEIGDLERMKGVMELLEESKYDDGSLRAYSKIALRLGDKTKIRYAAAALGDKIDDLRFLKIFTRLAMDLMDERLLKEAYQKLKNIHDDPWCIGRYARIAQFFDDFEGMARAQILLRQFLDRKDIRKTYDILDMRIKREIRNRQHARVHQRF